MDAAGGCYKEASGTGGSRGDKGRGSDRRGGNRGAHGVWRGEAAVGQTGCKTDSGYDQTVAEGVEARSGAGGSEVTDAPRSTSGGSTCTILAPGRVGMGGGGVESWQVSPASLAVVPSLRCCVACWEVGSLARLARRDSSGRLGPGSAGRVFGGPTGGGRGCALSTTSHWTQEGGMWRWGAASPS